MTARIDAGQGTVALIECPNGAGASAEEARVGAGDYRCGGSARRGIDAGQLRTLRVRHPERVAAERRVVGTRRHVERPQIAPLTGSMRARSPDLLVTSHMLPAP